MKKERVVLVVLCIYLAAFLLTAGFLLSISNQRHYLVESILSERGSIELLNASEFGGMSPECSFDEDCIERGPGFICSEGECSWKPPIGIPRPSFGIEETHYIYSGEYYEAGGFNYRDAGNGPYTHYVDNSVSCNDANAGGFGTAAEPRCTIPTVLSEGSVVEVHGGPYLGGTLLGSGDIPRYQITFSATGSENKPIFIRGTGTREVIINNTKTAFSIDSQYVIIENFDMHIPNFWPTWNISIRNNYIHNLYTVGGASVIGIMGQDTVIYNNFITDNLASGDGKEIHGVWVGDNSRRTWIVDNEISENDGDSIQVNACQGQHCRTIGEPEREPKYVFIGRNKMHDDCENAVDLKDSEHVIISQNEAYGYEYCGGSTGDAILPANEGGVLTWVLFNDLHDNVRAIRVDDEIFSVEHNIYIIGNKIYDNSHSGIATWQALNLYIYNNVFNNNGLMDFWSQNWPAATRQAKYYFHNNIFTSNTDYNLYIGWEEAAGNTSFMNNIVDSGIYFEGEVPTDYFVEEICSNCIHGDAGLDSDLSPGNELAEDTGFDVSSAADYFNLLYFDLFSQYDSLDSLNINVDFEGILRPQGSAWDIGAYEYSGCESDADCKCSGGIYYSSGTCNAGAGECNYGAGENCNSYDTWIDTGEVRWSDSGCSEEEEKEQEYHDFSCLVIGCQESITNARWVETGNTRNKPGGTICDDADICTESDECDGEGNCVGIPLEGCNNGFILHLEFEDNSSDSRGNYDVVNSGVDFTDGKIGRAGSFNGGYLSITGFEEMSNLTVAAWVKRAADFSGYKSILMRQEATGFGEPYMLGFNGNSFVWIIKTGSVEVINSGAITRGEWYHVAGTYDGESMILYVNGSEISRIEKTGSLATTSSGVYLGAARNSASMQEFFTGDIDDLRVYSRALSEDEIQMLAQVTDNATCGNGIVEPGEECEFPEACEVGGYSGLKDCVDCELQGCVSSEFCGDNLINGNEICDLENLTTTCSGLGFSSGNLSCLNNCSGYNVSLCNLPNPGGPSLPVEPVPASPSGGGGGGSSSSVKLSNLSRQNLANLSENFSSGDSNLEVAQKKDISEEDIQNRGDYIRRLAYVFLAAAGVALISIVSVLMRGKTRKAIRKKKKL